MKITDDNLEDYNEEQIIDHLSEHALELIDKKYLNIKKQRYGRRYFLFKDSSGYVTLGGNYIQGEVHIIATALYNGDFSIGRDVKYGDHILEKIKEIIEDVIN